MKRWLISLSCATLLSAAAFSALALPSVGDVQAEVKKGNYTQAQTMMREVVEAKPGSAKAHYIYAEILAHNARFVDAAEQARIAKQIDPAATFTTPEKFSAFQQLLDREQQAGRPTVSSPSANTAPRQSSPAPAAMPAPAPVEQRSSGIPIWVWIGAAAVLFIGWRMLSRRTAAPMMAGAAAGPAGAYGAGVPAGYGPGSQGYGPGQNFGGGMMQQPGRGSGLLGAGLAAAGGVAAGMMAEKYLSGNHEGNASNVANENANMGNSFASPERDQAAQDLESRDVDFGSGNDWSDQGSSDMGSSDGGSGSDDW